MTDRLEEIRERHREAMYFSVPATEDIGWLLARNTQLEEALERIQTLVEPSTSIGLFGLHDCLVEIQVEVARLRARSFLAVPPKGTT